jgi:transcriptional regulator with XRE-family HTH domain
VDAQRFGAWLREQRQNAKLSQEKAGRHMGVSGATISRWESGDDAPDPSRYPLIEQTYLLARGVVEQMLTPPSEGPSLDYWVGRWEQQTMHFRRVLADQEELLAHMRQRAGLLGESDARIEQEAIELTRREAAPVPSSASGSV